MEPTDRPNPKTQNPNVMSDKRAHAKVVFPDDDYVMIDRLETLRPVRDATEFANDEQKKEKK